MLHGRAMNSICEGQEGKPFSPSHRTMWLRWGRPGHTPRIPGIPGSLIATRSVLETRQYDTDTNPVTQSRRSTYTGSHFSHQILFWEKINFCFKCQVHCCMNVSAPSSHAHTCAVVNTQAHTHAHTLMVRFLSRLLPTSSPLSVLSTPETGWPLLSAPVQVRVRQLLQSQTLHLPSDPGPPCVFVCISMGKPRDAARRN